MKTLTCPICGREAGQERELYTNPHSYFDRCASVWCEKCSLYLYGDTLTKTRNKWKKLFKGE